MWLFGGKKSISFTAAAVTDQGLSRPDNQDAILSQPVRGCFAVADGMGGGQGGALASKWTCAALSDAFGRVASVPHEEKPAVVANALADANDRIRSYAKENSLRMMGCTVALFFGTPDGKGWICHVGDSRVYRVRDGKIKLLTRDHTVGNELSRLASQQSKADDARQLKSRRNPLSHVLTRAIGIEQSVRPDWQEADFLAGDRCLVCTDGVHDMLDDAEISLALKRAASPEACAEKLISGIRAAGAADNFSFVCVFVG